jgi:hypothetical protein
MVLDKEYFEAGSEYFIQVNSQLPGPLDPLEFVHPLYIEAITYRTTRYTCEDQVLVVHHEPVSISWHCLDRVPNQDRVLPPGSTYHACTYQYVLKDWRGNTVGDLFVDEVQHYGEGEELPENQGTAYPYEKSTHAGYFQQEVALNEFERLTEENNVQDRQTMQGLIMYHLTGKHILFDVDDPYWCRSRADRFKRG